MKHPRFNGRSPLLLQILDKLRFRPLVVIHDVLMVAIAWWAAYWLRFNLGTIPGAEFRQALAMLPVLLVVQAVIFQVLGLYRGLWRFASIPDLIRITKSIFFGVLISITIIFLITRMEDIPRSVFPIYGLLLLTFLGGPRFLYRWIRDWRSASKVGEYVLIVGAGETGGDLARNMLRDTARSYVPVAFVDDDSSRHDTDVYGIPVMGGGDAIPDLVKKLGIDLIVIALPGAKASQMRRIVNICSRTNLPFRTLPRMHDLLSGQVTISELREVSIEDLLGREPVTIDTDRVHEAVTGKAVLVTGGGGSIGTELCMQIAKFAPRELIIIEHSEINLYNIERQLREAFPDLELCSILGSTADPILVEDAMQTHSPNLVLHTAAYKHVPMLEKQARVAVKNNLLGTKTVADLSDQYGCDVFALISTDKAVNPTNLLGATKRVAEIYCQSLDARSNTRFVTVRFGNVLDSAGSVVPLFRSQIRAGGPVHVTHPEITRYFMTIPEACQLILQATSMGEGGEIFVLDMGEPIKIRDLAEEMIRLSGKTPGEDIEIVYSGLRPGEKLHEEMFHELETPIGTSSEKILLVRNREVNYPRLQEAMANFEARCQTNDIAGLISELAALVPEYTVRSAEAGKDSNVLPLVKKSAR